MRAADSQLVTARMPSLQATTHRCCTLAHAPDAEPWEGQQYHMFKQRSCRFSLCLCVGGVKPSHKQCCKG
jgi:hypothetical protein